MTELRPHPAKFTPVILDEISRLIELYALVGTAVDPFAGTGRVHDLAGPNLRTIGIEIEPEWAAYHPDTICGNAMDIGNLLSGISLQGVITSVGYGNRMADHHEARDVSVRNTYRHKLGRVPSPGSAAVMQWGDEYRDFHRRVYRRCWQKLDVGGLFILNVKDHIRRGKLVEVSAWHKKTLECIGMWVDTMQVSVTGNGFGANGKTRVDHEDIHVFVKRF